MSSARGFNREEGMEGGLEEGESNGEAVKELSPNQLPASLCTEFFIKKSMKQG